jgi:hypothetical protein
LRRLRSAAWTTARRSVTQNARFLGIPIVLTTVFYVLASSAFAAGPSVLRVVVSPPGKVSLTTRTGQVVRQLKPGTYAIDARDRSARYGFSLSGPWTGPNTEIGRTGIKFVGRKTMRLYLAVGTYRYSSRPLSSTQRTLRVVQ